MTGIRGLFNNVGNRNITNQDYKDVKKDLKQNEQIKFSGKEPANNVKSGDLGEYLDNTGLEMKQALGLSLSTKAAKTDTTQNVDEAKALAQNVKLDGDLSKVLSYINTANYPRIANETSGYQKRMDNVINANTTSNAEKLFASQDFTLDDVFMQEFYLS